MSFANTTGHSEWSVNSGKTYISTDNFAGAFYTYTVTTDSNLATIGTLTTVATAVGDLTSSRFGRGHHLVLNGRKLTPGANPMNAITRNTTQANNPFIYGSTPGSTTVALSPSGASATSQSSSSNPPTFAPKFMVGVADVQTGLNGFIDPTNVLFALYDKNRPVSDYLVDMSAGLTAANAREVVSSGQSDRVNTTSVALGSVAFNSGSISIGNASSGSITLSSVTGNNTFTTTINSSIVTPTSIIMLTPINNSLRTTQTYTKVVVLDNNNSQPNYYLTFPVPVTASYCVGTVTTGSFQIVIDLTSVTGFNVAGAPGYNGSGGLTGTTGAITPAFNFLIVN